MNQGSDDEARAAAAEISDEIRAATEASEWREKLPNASAQEKEKFSRWICEGDGTGNLREFLDMEVTEDDLNNFDFKNEIDGEALVAAALEDTTDPDQQNEGRALVVYDDGAREATTVMLPERRLMSKMYVGLGVAVVVTTTCCLIIWALLFYPELLKVNDGLLYSTRGTDRTVTLEDGSEMYMGAGTTARVRINALGRDVELTAGEAIFSVKHARSPFRVYVGDTVITAVGTQFRVALRADQTLVAVIAGKVEISGGDDGDKAPRGLAAGHAVTVLPNGAVVGDEGARVSSVQASRRSDPLVFNGSRLDEVAAAYNERGWDVPPLVVEDGARSQTLFAIIPADDPQLLVSILGSQQGLRVTREGGKVVVRLRSEGGSGDGASE